MTSESASIIYNDKDLNLSSAALLAKELIKFYREYEELIPNLTLRELKLIADLLLQYTQKIICNCIFIDCNYQSTINDVWKHSLTCKHNPNYIFISKSLDSNNQLLDKVKVQLKDATNLKPYQVEYYTSLSESYIKENTYIEMKSNMNVNYFQSFKHSNKWKIQENSYSYQTYTKKEDTGLISTKTKVLVTAPIKSVFYFCDNPDNIIDYNKFCNDSYSIRQINTNTRLCYFRTKPGFGITDFIAIQQVFMKGKTALILRNSLDESESPHKYTPQKENFVDIKRGFCFLEAIELSFIDSMTTELIYYHNIDYKLKSDYHEVIKGIVDYSLKWPKVMKECIEKKELSKRELNK